MAARAYTSKAALNRRTPYKHAIDRNLFAAGDAGEFFLEAFAFGGVFGFDKLIGQFEEAVVLGLLGLQAGFDQVDEDAAGGRMAGFGQGTNPIRDATRQRDALADG